MNENAKVPICGATSDEGGDRDLNEYEVDVARIAFLDPDDREAEVMRLAKKHNKTDVEVRTDVGLLRADALSQPEGEAYIAELNREWAVVPEAGQTFIAKIIPVKEQGKQREFAYYSRESFRLLYLNRPVRVGRTRVDLGQYWLSHPDRRQYLGGTVFDPSNNHRNDQLNLWTGLAVAPKAGDWSLMQAHIRDNICNGDERSYEYIINWMARKVQNPGWSGEVALCLVGPEGVGKTKMMQMLNRVFGVHAMTIDKPDHLTGRFNDHLRRTVFAAVEEAVFAGDNAAMRSLKHMVNGETLSYERKFGGVVKDQNMLAIAIATNSPQVVQASEESRRWFVLNVGVAQRRNYDYFRAIDEQMFRQGGLEAMLHDLLHRDLSKFNVRDYPETQALNEQRLLSMDPQHAWLYDMLYRGTVEDSPHCVEAHKWHTSVTTQRLFQSYKAYMQARGRTRYAASREAFGDMLKNKFGFSKARNSSAWHGEEGDRFNEWSPIKLTVTKNAYVFGELKEARDAFTSATGLKVDWPEEDGEPDPNAPPPPKILF